MNAGPDPDSRLARRRARMAAQHTQRTGKRSRLLRLGRPMLIVALVAVFFFGVSRMVSPTKDDASDNLADSLADSTDNGLAATTPTLAPVTVPPILASTPEPTPTPTPQPTLMFIPTPTPRPTPDAEAYARHEALLAAGLVDVRGFYDEGIAIDMRYAGGDNFMGQAMYPGDGCYLSAQTAQKLLAAQRIVAAEGKRILILDAYRPHRYQQTLYDRVEDKQYVASPTTASRHNRGAAVDVTLCDGFGIACPMPSDYDEFTEAATRAYTLATEEQTANLALLTRAMREAGFATIRSEWWHYDDAQWKELPVLDEDLPAWFGKMP